jgi:hypothetical protein
MPIMARKEGAMTWDELRAFEENTTVFCADGAWGKLEKRWLTGAGVRVVTERKLRHIPLDCLEEMHSGRYLREKPA